MQFEKFTCHEHISYIRAVQAPTSQEFPVDDARLSKGDDLGIQIQPKMLKQSGDDHAMGNVRPTMSMDLNPMPYNKGSYIHSTPLQKFIKNYLSFKKYL